jgi:hypothetical protein
MKVCFCLVELDNSPSESTSSDQGVTLKWNDSFTFQVSEEKLSEFNTLKSFSILAMQILKKQNFPDVELYGFQITPSVNGTRIVYPTDEAFWKRLYDSKQRYVVTVGFMNKTTAPLKHAQWGEEDETDETDETIAKRQRLQMYFETISNLHDRVKSLEM